MFACTDLRAKVRPDHRVNSPPNAHVHSCACMCVCVCVCSICVCVQVIYCITAKYRYIARVFVCVCVVCVCFRVIYCVINIFCYKYVQLYCTDTELTWHTNTRTQLHQLTLYTTH